MFGEGDLIIFTYALPEDNAAELTWKPEASTARAAKWPTRESKTSTNPRW